MGMKKFLAVIMMLVMLTPSLACAMPVCADEAQAAATEQPCAEHHPGHESSDKKDTGKVNFLLDCMGVDLQKADTASLDKPDLKADPVIYALAADIVTSPLAHADSSTIRGPPPDWSALSRTQPSILLTTQRFRI